MKKFMVYLDDGKDVFKAAIPGKSAKEVRKYVEGNGEVIKIKDVTDDYPISLQKVSNALEAAGFGKIEQNFIIRALDFMGIAE